MNRRRFLLLCVCVLMPLAAPSRAQDATHGPRPGKYRILTYGPPTSPPIFLGSLVLGSGSYKAYDPGNKLTGEGRYSYNTATHAVTWESGPYVGVWGGEFTIE